MKSTGIILAGGSSSRFGTDKGLARVIGKPLIEHVIDAIKPIVDETLIVVNSERQAGEYRKIQKHNASIVLDNIRANQIQSPIVGASAGFNAAHGGYSVLLACDAPLVSPSVLLLLLDLCIGKNAAIPRWPNCNIEPLQAAYNTRAAAEASMTALQDGSFNLASVIDRLHGVRYVSTLVIQELDPMLETFFNVNRMVDLKKAENLLRRRIADQVKGKQRH